MTDPPGVQWNFQQMLTLGALLVMLLSFVFVFIGGLLRAYGWMFTSSRWSWLDEDDWGGPLG
jgi:hypothetical protein